MQHAAIRILDSEELDRRILLDADGVVVVDKPWGLPSSGRRLNDPGSVQYALQQRYVQMVWAVHQLDADTSGVNVFVRRRELVKNWHERLRFPNGQKTYIAFVDGPFRGTTTVDAPIGPLPEPFHKTLGIVGDGRPARSHFECLAHGDDAAVVAVRIETGRTHQIRIHAQSLGHPLLGEDWYRVHRCRRHRRQALHAAEIRFADGDQPTVLRSPLSGDLVELAEQLGFRDALEAWITPPR